MDEIVAVEPVQRELAVVFDERYADLAFPEDISFDDAVERVKAAKRLKQDVIGELHASYRAYIAELSTCHAVEQGGVSRFARLCGLNYANLRQWRSRYLPADKKRKYARAVVTVSQLPEPAPEPEVIDAVVEEVVESEPVFEDMFDGRERKASELEADPEEAVALHKKFISRRIRTFLKTLLEDESDIHRLYMTIHYRDGEVHFVDRHQADDEPEE